MKFEIHNPIVPILTIFLLTGCGGSGNDSAPVDDGSGSDLTNPDAQSTEAQWTKIDDEYGYNLGIYEKDGVVYTSTHTTRDGVNFESYHTPDLNFGAQYRLLSYIDESNRFYLFQALSTPEFVETNQWTFYNWATFGDIRYMAGTSDYLISASYQSNAPALPAAQRDVVEYSTGDAQIWQPVELSNGDNIITNGIAKPADNKTGTIVLTDQFDGAWITSDGGRTWNHILQDMGYLDLSIGSDDYANDFYVIGIDSGMYSADGGSTWSDITVPNYTADRWVAGAIDSSNGDVIIWGLNPSEGDSVFKSSDKGMTWEAVGPMTDAVACELCAVPDIVANEYGYFISANTLYFLSK